MARGRAIPYWARKRRELHEADANDRWQQRHGALVGELFVDVLWSNRTAQAYHLRCRPLAPDDVWEMALDSEREGRGVCGACGHPLKP